MKSSSKRRIRPIHARAATADPSALEDYGPEPNMKLSHAFIVVLALHVVAVGGLFAFNKVKAHHMSSTAKIKTENAVERPAVATSGASVVAQSSVPSHQIAAPASAASTGAETASVASPTAAAAPVAPPASGGGGAPQPPAPTPTSTPPVVAAPPTSDSAAEAAPTAPAAVSTEYTVVKGDNPYKIAKRFHVSYDSLIKLNNITDPRKIQIGQKLKIPAVTSRKVIKSVKKHN